MFDQFKTQHRGLGPFQMLADSLSGGLLSHNRAAELAQQQWTALFDGIGADETLPESFRSDAARIRAQQWSLGDAVQLMEQFKQRAGTIKTVQDAASGNRAYIDQLRSTAVGANDLEQLDGFANTLKIAEEYALSSNPKLQETGQSLLIEAARGLQQYATTNETQRIADDVARRTEGTAGEALRYNRDMALSGELRKDVVAPYQEQELAFSKAKQLLDTGDRLGYDFAFTMAIQSLDGSVVRSEERMAYTGSNGLTAQAVDLYNRWQGNKTPEVEAALRRAIGALHNANAETYRKTVDTYRAQTAAYGGDWSRVGSVVPEMQDWENPGKTDKPAPPEPEANPLGVAAAGASILYDQVPPEVKGAGAVIAAPAAARLAATALPYVAPAAYASAQGAAMVLGTRRLPGEPPRSPNIRRGVYVPPFMRRLFTDEYPGSEQP